MRPAPHPARADLAALHPAFFDEAGDSLRRMEQLLLAIEPDHPDEEALNSIFRCAHSVKGGAAAFGFGDVAALAHRIESLLERWRKRRPGPTAESVALLLQCGDALRDRLARWAAGSATSDASADPAIEWLLQRFDPPADGSPPPGRAGHADRAASARVLELDIGPSWQGAPTAGLLQMFADVAELGRIQTLDDGIAPGGVRRFSLHTGCRDDELLALLAMHGPAGDLQLRPAPALPDADTDSAPAPTGVPVESAQAVRAAHPATLRVAAEKIDRLINLAGELLIAQSALTQACGAQTRQPVLAGALAGLERPLRELQQAVMAMRMVPMSAAFGRFPRLLHDLSARLGKQLRLRTEGEATEIDKGMAEGLADPLLHLLRNACDHGIENPAERLACGKPAVGTVTLSAAHQAGSMRIEVHDDGRGLSREGLLRRARERGLRCDAQMADAQVWELAFLPGLSTAERLSDVSGRGVGMDVVRQNIVALGGTVQIESTAGVGTRVSMCVPLTLAVIDAVSVAIGDERFVLPLAAVVEALPAQSARVAGAAGGRQHLQWREQSIPVLDLQRLFALPPAAAPPTAPDLARRNAAEAGGRDLFIVVEADGERAAMAVTRLLGQHQAVVKKLDAALCEAGQASAATILGDGSVALILDTDRLVRGAWADERRCGGLQVMACAAA